MDIVSYLRRDPASEHQEKHVTVPMLPSLIIVGYGHWSGMIWHHHHIHRYHQIKFHCHRQEKNLVIRLLVIMLIRQLMEIVAVVVVLEINFD